MMDEPQTEVTTPRRRPARLPRTQRDALEMIRQADPGEAYLLARDQSFTESGPGGGRLQPWTQAFINWRTARALERRGLVRITGQGEDATIYVAGEQSG